MVIPAGLLVLTATAGAQQAPAVTATGTPGAPSAPVSAPQNLIYSVNRTPEPLFETARSAIVIGRDEIERRNARSLADLLSEHGVYISEFSAYSQSPYMRGLSGRRVLIMVDGVQMNTASVRFRPAQIDMGDVERVEIVRGVGSVLGSESMGGIVNVITRHGSGARLDGSAETRFSGADGSRTGRLSLHGQTPKLRYAFNVTSQNNGDVAGGRSALPDPTSYQYHAGSGTVDYFVSDEKTLTASMREYVALHAKSPLTTASATYLARERSPERTQLTSLRYQDQTVRPLWTSLQVTGYLHREQDDQFAIRAATPNRQETFHETARLLGLNAEAAAFQSERHRLVYGLDASTERIHSQQRLVDPVAGFDSVRHGAHIDGATYSSAALYVQDRITLGRLEATLGTRAGHFRIGGKTGFRNDSMDVTGSKSAVTGAAHFAYRLRPSVHLIANASSGFRAPNLDDIGDFKVSGDVPNPSLNPERVRAYEGGIKVERSRVSASAFYYLTRIVDRIATGGGTYNGLTFRDLNGNGVKDPNERDVRMPINRGTDATRGVELELALRPVRGFTLWGTQTTTVGDDETNRVALPSIPPRVGTVGARWISARHRHPWAEATYNYATAKSRFAPTELQTVPGVRGYDVGNVRAGLDVAPWLPVSLGIENVTDAQYRSYISSVWRPGRQVVLGVAARF